TSVIKRAGDEVMMSCSKLIDGQQNCSRTTWRFAGLKSDTTEALVDLGQINNFKPNRLNLTSNCSLVIKEVREEDAGRYECQQWKPENTETPFHQSDIDLSVVNF
uniref:Ig-like domain-containing protein n=1 Tax=Poecilia mexicana TaxID=48701 RepID=A0A3B3YR42_9TELE